MAEYFVAPTGSNANSGSFASPWQTITYGAGQLAGGDILTLKDGTYTDTNQVSLPSGSAGAWTTVRALNPRGAIIAHNNYATFRPGANSFILIEGLTFDLGSDGGGVNSEGGHHVTMRNCAVNGGGYHAFTGQDGDFFVVEDCDISGMRFTSWWSAISFFRLYNASGVSVTGFRNVVRNNVIDYCYTVAGALTDGNGIIIDDSRNTLDGPHPNAVYAFDTLIEQNLVSRCGGKGIQVYRSNRVTVRNNTCAHNGNPGQTHDGSTWWAELSFSYADNCVAVNNIAVTTPGRHGGNQRCFADTGDGSTAGMNNADVVWANNCGWNGSGSTTWTNGAGDGPQAAQNPLLGIDPALESDFTLAAGSPCIGAGTDGYGLPETDLAGGTRVVGAAVDLGPYEYGASYNMDLMVYSPGGVPTAIRHVNSQGVVGASAPLTPA